MTDLSALSDDQLRALYQQQAAPPLASMSDEQLKAAYAAADKIGNPVAETARAFNENVQTAKAGLGTDRTAQTIADMKGRPFWDITPQINSVLSFGKGVMAVPGAAAAPITGTARSVIGAPLAATAEAVDQAAQAKGITPPNGGGNYADLGRSGADMAMSAVAPRGYSPVGPRLQPAPIPTGADLKAAGAQVYSDPAIKSLQISPDALQAKVAQINNELTTQGFRPTPESAPATFREIGNLTPPAPKPVDYWTRVEAEMNGQPIPENAPAVKSVSVDDLRAARRALNKTAGLRDNIGQPTPDAEAARQAIGHIDDLIGSVAPELKTANANYSAGKMADQLDYRRMQADRRAAKSGSGTNIENTMRQEVDKIRNRGLTPDEQAMRDQIVQGTMLRNALRRVGKLGYGDGLSMTQHMLAVPLTGGASIPVGIGGMVARKTGEAMTRSAIQELSNAIRSRAPLSVNQPPVIPQTNKIGRIAAALLMERGNPSAVGLMPAYADQNQ